MWQVVHELAECCQVLVYVCPVYSYPLMPLNRLDWFPSWTEKLCPTW